MGVSSAIAAREEPQISTHSGHIPRPYTPRVITRPFHAEQNAALGVSRHSSRWNGGRHFRAIWGSFATVLAIALSLCVTGQATAQDAPNPTTTTMPATTVRTVPAARQANDVVVITIEGPIDGMTSRSVMRRIKNAEDSNANAIVIELNTPGGEVGAVLEICDAIKNSKINNSVAWINTKAYSGGAIIALACREIVVTDTAAMGDAKPVTISPTTISGLKGLTADEKEKLLPPLIAEVTNSVRRHNRAANAYVWDEMLAQAIIATDAQLWLVEDTQTGTRFCVDANEFVALFPEQPITQPLLATAGVGSVLPQLAPKVEPTPAAPGAGQAPAGEAPAASGSGETPTPSPFVPASDSLRSLSPDINRALADTGSTPSLRPRIVVPNNGRYKLLGLVSNGKGAIVMGAEEMRFLGLASNVGAGTTPTLEPIRTDADLKTYFAAARLVRLDETWSESMVRFMTEPWVRGILIVIFLIALFLEMSHPGVTLPALVAMTALVLLIAPPMLVGMASWWEVAAILVGLVMVGLEIFVIPGFGVIGVVGLLLLFVGLVFSFTQSTTDVFRSGSQANAQLLTGMVTVLLAMFSAGLGIYFIARNFGSLPLFKHLVLQNPSESGDTMLTAMDMSDSPVQLGDEGIAITPLRPSGRAEFAGQIVDVVAEMGFIELGSAVRVVEVTGLRVAVARVVPRTAEVKPAS